MRRTIAIALSVAALGAVTALTVAAQAGAPKQDKSLIAHGRYLVQIAACNDCHTPGYMQTAGQVDEKLWLTGDRLAWNGPWGTTYAINVRLYMQGMTEAQWLQAARTMKPRPPMPWFNVHAMSDRDLRAIYQYVQALGPGGEPAPAYLPPGEVPKGPVVRFE